MRVRRVTYPYASGHSAADGTAWSANATVNHAEDARASLTAPRNVTAKSTVAPRARHACCAFETSGDDIHVPWTTRHTE